MLDQTASTMATRFATSAATTYRASFDEDVQACRSLGIAGLGLWEFKLAGGDDRSRAALLHDSGIRATYCFPNTPGVLHGDGLFAEPKDPDERLELLCESIRRFAVFEPAAVVCLAGAPDRVDDADRRRRAVRSIEVAALVARDAGVRLALEVISPGARGSYASTITGALELLSEAKADDVGVLADAWHTPGTPQCLDELRRNIDRIAGIQVCDRASDFRGWYDRIFPGHGTLQVADLIRGAEEAGYTGWYELEIFSDDGTFGSAYPDSLWRRQPRDVLEQGLASYLATCGDAAR